MAAILVRVRAFCIVVELIDGKIDESREVAIVNRVRVGVIRHKVEILDALDRGYSSTMVIGVRYVIVVVLESSAERLQARSEHSAKKRAQAGQCTRTQG